MTRDDLIEKNKHRRGLESIFKGRITVALEELHPRAIGSRFINLQKRKLIDSGNEAGKFARKNASWIVAGGLVTLLIAARIPIIKRINGLRDRAANAKDQD
jgi:hypothetical protein